MLNKRHIIIAWPTSHFASLCVCASIYIMYLVAATITSVPHSFPFVPNACLFVCLYRKLSHKMFSLSFSLSFPSLWLSFHLLCFVCLFVYFCWTISFPSSTTNTTKRSTRSNTVTNRIVTILTFCKTLIPQCELHSLAHIVRYECGRLLCHINTSQSGEYANFG